MFKYRLLSRLLAVAFLASPATAFSQSPNILTAQEILGTLDPNCLGCGTDMYTDTSDEHAMAFALLASAGAEMGDEALARAAADWLVENNGTSVAPAGWGLSFAWDAFADKSVNPVSTVYGITTALAVRGLLDVYEMTSDRPYLDAAHEAMSYYSQFFTHTEHGGFFWYSDQITDEINVFNVSSMLMGQAARLGKLTEDDHLLELSELAHSDLLSHALSEGRFQYWIYDPMRPNQRPNDSVHAAYVVQGLIDYSRATGGGPPPPAQTDYLTQFILEDITVMWSAVHDLPPHLQNRPAKLWAPGMLVFTLIESGDEKGARRYAELLTDYYVAGQGLRTSLDDEVVSDPRMVSHALLGAARLEALQN